MVEKLNRLRNWQIALVIAIVGFVVFSAGLTNPFQGDDQTQIVNNPVVHSISHVKLLFEGGTSYNGSGIAPLAGTYYRPLMDTVFSILYTLFGPHTLFFHLFQLLLYIGSAILLYLVFSYSFGTLLSLVLALTFLVHPLNSQVVYAIPSMQDALFFFFGILAFWLLLRFKSVRSLTLVALCLFLSMISKEAGMYFLIMALIYLIVFDRKRALPFVGIMAAPFALYWALRIHAVGFSSHLAVAPIDNLNLGQRLLTAPSIMSFYLTKFLFPWKLATAYYWAYTTFSVRHVLLPLIIDLAVVALGVFLAFVVKRRSSKMQFYTYLFFATWAVVGLVPYLQIVPLDMTACETWFIFPMAGVLGMLGVLLMTLQKRIRPNWFVLIAALVIGILGVRSFMRSFDYRSVYILSKANIAASKEDYMAYGNLAQYDIDQGDYAQAKYDGQYSVHIYPSYTNYTNLGLALQDLGDYAGANQAYQAGLKYGSSYQLWINLAALTVVYGSFNEDGQTLEHALGQYPENSLLWMYAAILEEKYNYNADAKTYITKAAMYGQVPAFIYNNIMSDHPFSINVSNVGVTVRIP